MNAICARITPAPWSRRRVLGVEFQRLAGVTTLACNGLRKGSKGSFGPASGFAPEVTPEVTPEVRLVQVLVGEMTRQQLQRALGLKDDEHFRKAYLQPALDAGLIEMTIPDKPRSSRQKYRLTAKGGKKGAKGT